MPHPGDENFGTWGLNGWQDRRGPGVWVPMTVDPVNDLVFVPLGNATDQNYGGSRPGENLYATTLLVLQASTGKRKWHFQLTHHDIYDWDVGSPPALIEAMKDGQRVPAVAQMTQAGPAVHVPPPDRRAAVWRRGAAGAAIRRARRSRHGRRSRFPSNRPG